MFIQTEETPNPLSIKFFPDCEVMSKGIAEFIKADGEFEISPLASALFEIEGIEKIFLSTNFITVTKSESADWDELRPQILGFIMEHFNSGESVVHASFYSNDNFQKTQNEIENKIINILEQLISPALARDGGAIEFHKYEDNIVYVYLRGACAGCPGAKITLKNGVERILREYIPEIAGVKALNFKD